jgi:hypothetical protein
MIWAVGAWLISHGVYLMPIGGLRILCSLVACEKKGS